MEVLARLQIRARWRRVALPPGSSSEAFRSYGAAVGLLALGLAVTGLAAASPLAAADLLGVEPQYRETKELMAFVADASDLVAERGVTAACEELRQADSRWRFGDEYVFVLASDGTMLCHPGQPSLEGRAVLDLRDPKGKPILENMLREVKTGDEGWVHYLWPRPGDDTFVWKTTYVRQVAAPERGDVIVGSGIYQMKIEPFLVVEQVKDAVALIEREGAAAFDRLRDEAGGFRFYDFYLFVMEESGVHLVNAGFPEYEGKNLLDFEDAEGTLIGPEMLRLVRTEGAGWVDYTWPRPGDTALSRKSTYVRKAMLGDQLLVVGAGVYEPLKARE